MLLKLLEQTGAHHAKIQVAILSLAASQYLLVRQSGYSPFGLPVFGF